MSKSEIWAHRGAHFNRTYLENGAYAIALGFLITGHVEVDIMHCKDSIIVMHDDDMMRLFSSSSVVKNTTHHNIQGIVDRCYPGEIIPTLNTLLDLLEYTNNRLGNFKCKLNIELKGENLVHPLSIELNKRIESKQINANQIVISSFHWPSLALFSEVKRKTDTLRPIEVGVLAEKIGTEIKSVETAIRYAEKIKANALHIDKVLFVKETETLLKNLDLRLRIYTVNSTDNNFENIYTDIVNLFCKIPKDIHKKANGLLENLALDCPQNFKPIDVSII